MLAAKMFHNVYYVPHEPSLEKEMKDDFNFYLPLIIMLGAALIIMEYVFRAMEGDL